MQSVVYIDFARRAGKRIHAAAYVKTWAAKGWAEKILAEIRMEKISKNQVILFLEN